MKTILQKFTATGGYLENSSINFEEGLNCIIGAPGTCKSTLIESIRFAFNTNKEKVNKLIGKSEVKDNTGFFEKVSKTLDSGTIKCEIFDIESKTSFSIERDITSDPRVYKEGVMDYTDTLVLNQIEIYSQGDLQKIAEQENLRLQLIDRPKLTEIKGISKSQKQVAAKLEENGPKIKNLRSRIDLLKNQIKVLPELRSQLKIEKENSPQLSQQLDEQRNLFLKRKKALELFNQVIEVKDEAVNNLFDRTAEKLKRLLETVKSLDLTETQSLIESVSSFAGIFDLILKEINKIENLDLSNIRDSFESKIEELNESYYSLRKVEQDANESLKKEDELKRQIEILTAYEAELNELSLQIVKHIDERAELRQKLQNLSSEKYELRLAEVESINERHGDLVVLSIEQNALGDKYLAKVKDLLNGSRLRNQDEIASEIAELLNPEDLVDLVEAGNTEDLASVLNRDKVQMTRLMSFLMDSEDLCKLEGHIFEDKLSISMFDDGQPKPVRDLSNGQKATALLPLILRDADYPLIFDQPEDDLDNRFIFNNLVKSVLELKLKRQIIFVTHNANIPVLGEAENIVVMNMKTPRKAAPANQGNVNESKQEIINLLEGGAEAFLQRHKRYENLLNLDD
jgi:DNA repair ATPase RecN